MQLYLLKSLLQMCFCNWYIWQCSSHLPLRIQEKWHANNYLPLCPSEEYWASLQDAAFIRLVQMFKRAITAQLHYWTESSENNYHVKALLEILKKLHRVSVLSDMHRFLFCSKKKIPWFQLAWIFSRLRKRLYCYF